MLGWRADDADDRAGEEREREQEAAGERGSCGSIHGAAHGSNPAPCASRNRAWFTRR